jgi:hypothetical protein
LLACCSAGSCCMHCLLRAWPCCCMLGQRQVRIDLSIVEASNRHALGLWWTIVVMVRDRLANGLHSTSSAMYVGKLKVREAYRSRYGATWRPSRRHRLLLLQYGTDPAQLAIHISWHTLRPRSIRVHNISKLWV